MQPDPRALLADVEQAGADIEYFTAGMSREAYLDDIRTQAAVERKFEIIGEALNRLHQINPEISSHITSLREIVNFRNVLIHGYAKIMPSRVWDYVEYDLQVLRKQVHELLVELGPPES